jgi:nucleoid-associated protein YgaU
MQHSLQPRHFRIGRPPAVAPNRDLVVLLAWLAIFGLGLRLLVGWPKMLPAPELLPSWTVVEVWALSPGGSLAGLISVAAFVAWAVWLWTFASVLLRVGLDFADAFSRGARWVGSLRRASDWLTLPFVRHAVDASLAGLLLARVVAQPGIASASMLPDVQVAMVAQPDAERAGHTEEVTRNSVLLTQSADPSSAEESEDVIYTVKHGDTLSGIAVALYGDADQAERIYQANLGRDEPGGRQFNRHGLILPGWTLQIPSATRGVIQDDAGTRWYVVQHSDTLSGIAQRVLGDQQRYPELFAMNVGVARLGDDGPVLRNQNLIWPGLRLRLPDDPSATIADPPTTDPALSAPLAPAVSEEEAAAPSSPPEAIASPTPLPESIDSPTTAAASILAVTPSTADTAAPATAATPESVPTLAPLGTRRTPQPAQAQFDPAIAAEGAAGISAVALAAGALVVRRRRPAPIPTGPETDIRIENGFAEADPVEGLARRLAQTSDPLSAIASLMSQAYSRIFSEQLTSDQLYEASTAVQLAAARHGRTATTLILNAPVPARPYLVRSMRAAAEHAFGKHVDVDGLVSHDGDVLVRLTWDPRRPVPTRVLELVSAEPNTALWPTPLLVCLLAGYDRQPIDVNWHTVSNVLVTSPTGQGSETPLIALLASLASVRRPEDLGVVLLARPHTLPEEIGLLPQVLTDTIDPADSAAVNHMLDDVRRELDNRAAGEGTAEQPDLVVVVREMCDLEPSAIAQLGVLAAAGPVHNVRVIVGSERPVAELAKVCPFLNAFGTRIVLRTRDEEESIALIGAPGAEELGRGGHALLRLEGRVPIQGWACRVPPEHLARLLELMGTRVRNATREPEATAPVSATSDDAEDLDDDEGSTESEPAEPPQDLPTTNVDHAIAQQPAAIADGHAALTSPLLEKLLSAPIRVCCFGARDVWYGDQVLDLRDTELLVLLAAHPVRGIQSEALVDMLWEEELTDPERALRVRRSRSRKELRGLVPELVGDPFPGDSAHGERVVIMNPQWIASDVHEFLELLRCAGKLDSAGAIEAYEQALALYRGDLLDAADIPNSRWMYDGPQIALTLRSDYRRQHHDARLRLAELRASGPESGLVRAEELYSALCAEEPEDERLWTALFRVYERGGNALGLESSVRKLRSTLAELAPGEPNVETFPLPAKLDTLVTQIRNRLAIRPDQAA